jgi:hypothetical protein
VSNIGSVGAWVRRRAAGAVRFLSIKGAAAALIVSSAFSVASFSAATASAQDEKPVVVVSINKLNELMGDIGALSEVANQQDAGRLALGMAGIYTGGIDRNKPAGAYVTMGPTGPKVVGFLPVTNLKQLLGTYREQIGSPRDKGDGVLEIGADRPQPLYVKEQGGWAFVVQDPRSLQGLPADPTKMLGGLEAKYDIAIQLNVANIPAELRDLVVSQIKMGYDQAMQAQSRNLPADQREVANEVGKALVQGIEEFIEQAEQVTVGFAIDATTKTTSLELSMTAKEGTDLAKQMVSMYDIRSLFAALGGKDPAAKGNISIKLEANEIAQLTGLLKMAREGAMKGIDQDSGVPADKRDVLKAGVNGILDVIDATVASGKLDFGGAVTLGADSSDLVGGAYVKDGAKLEKAVKSLVGLGKGEPNFPKVELDVGKYNGVNFHRLVIPASELDPNARRVFGEHVELVIGFGPDRAMIAMGRDGQSILKQAIDAGGANGAEAMPLQFQAALGKWVRFADKMDSNAKSRALASAAENLKTSDIVTIALKPIPRGMAYRYELSSGVMELLGAAAKAAQENP